MKGLGLRRAATLAMMSLLVTGCIPVPVPIPASPPRFSSEQLAQITEGLTTRDGVASTLGTPDLRRAHDQFWFYQWTVDRGGLCFFPECLLPGAQLDPLSSEQLILVLQFDEGGVLRGKEVAGLTDNRAERNCTASGVCVERLFGHDGGLTVLGARRRLQSFDETGSAVTVRGAAKERVAWPVLSAAKCLLVLWPEEDWDRQPGMQFKVADYDVWLPTRAFAVFDLPTGEYAQRGSPDRGGVEIARLPVPPTVGPC